MTYSLIQLAPGAYDLLLNGEVMGSVVRSGYRSTDTTWTAELLEDLPRASDLRRSSRSSIVSDAGGLVRLARQSKSSKATSDAVSSPAAPEISVSLGPSGSTDIHTTQPDPGPRSNCRSAFASFRQNSCNRLPYQFIAPPNRVLPATGQTRMSLKKLRNRLHRRNEASKTGRRW